MTFSYPFHRVLRLFLLSILLLNVVSESAIAKAARPNIILIYTDDQGYHDLGCFGSTKIKTPHIDKMAREGLKLTSFYAQAVCGVSRAALMTGSYPIRIGEPKNFKHLHTVPHPEEVTMAEMLGDAGYETALIGKWHLTLKNPKAPGGFEPTTMPNAQGFDHFYGTPMFNGFTVYVEDTNFRSPLYRNEKVVKEKIESWDHITADYTREALSWIEANQKEPFFLYLAHNLPHVPVGASENFKGKSDYGPYGDTIEEIDWSTGEILKKLKELDLDENTLVIFTSDNGPWVETTRGMKPDGGKFIPRDHSGDASPLRGWKMSAWDGGCRVPCVMRWPAGIPANGVSDQILSTMDLFPTFAKLAGGKLPDVTLDGSDASSFITGATKKSPRKNYFYYSGCLLTGVREGNWKLVLPRKDNPKGTGWWGRMIDEVKDVQLFDLKDDPGESKNLAAKNPKVVAKLMKSIKAMQKELGGIEKGGPGARSFDDDPRQVQGVPVKKAPKKKTSAKGKSVAAKYDEFKPEGNLRFTFESGKLEGWSIVAGKAGQSVVAAVSLPAWKEKPFNKEGRYHLSTINLGDAVSDKQQVAFESPQFKVKGDKASFLLSGGGQKDRLFVALMDAKSGNVLANAFGPKGPQMKRIHWDVSKAKGKVAYLKVVDQSQGGWGHLCFDDFSVEGELVAQRVEQVKKAPVAFGEQISASGIRHSFLITGSRTAIISEDNKIVWEVPGRSRDGSMLPNGNLLISHTKEAKEYTRDGKVVWSYALDPANKEMGTSVRLKNGNTLIIERGAKPRLLEVTPDGKIAVNCPLKPDTDNAHMQTRMARKLPNGNYIVPHLLGFAVKEYQPDGKVIRTIKTDLEELGGRKEENWPFTAILLENERLLVNLTHGNKTVEFDKAGKVVWRVDNSHAGGRFADPCGGQRLSNGNTVICSYGQRKPEMAKVFEISAEKEVVWEYKNTKLRGVHEIHVLTTNGKKLGVPMK
ncbi:sulfatase [bacterium]|nr:sulfatase [bacterium]